MSLKKTKQNIKKLKKKNIKNHKYEKKGSTSLLVNNSYFLAVNSIVTYLSVAPYIWKLRNYYGVGDSKVIAKDWIVLGFL